MKKFWRPLYLALCMAICLIPLASSGVSAETVTYPVTGGNIYFDTETGAITDCDKSVTEATIPNSINGKAVTSIGEDAFWACGNLANITIPNSVTSIRDSAFGYCTELVNISIPDSVISIGHCAFLSCQSVTKISVDENNPSYCDINGVLFNKDRSTLIQFPRNNKSTSYAIPNSVTYIRSYAFQDCDSLISITIPDSVTDIGLKSFISSGFTYCDNLENITVDENNPSYCDINGVLFNKDRSTLIQFPRNNKSTSYAIPNSVTYIGECAFMLCHNLTSITIPNSVTYIGETAFGYCDNLTSIIIPDSVTGIGSVAFQYCDNLTSIIIPNSVTSIEDLAFLGCNNLTIYGYLNSYAEDYATENNIPDKSMGVTPGTKVSENDLFIKYPQYLNNQADFTITKNMTKAYLNALDNTSSWSKTFSASLLYGFDSGSEILMRNLFSHCGYTSNYDKFLNDVVNSLIFSTANCDDMTSVTEDINSWVKNMKTGYDFADSASKEAFIKQLSNRCPSLSKTQARELTEALSEKQSKIASAFKAAGIALDISDVVITTAMIQNVRIEIVDSLMRNVNPNTDLYKGLQRFREKQVNNFAGCVVESLLDDVGIGMLADLYQDMLTSGAADIVTLAKAQSYHCAGLIVGVTVKVANAFLPGGNDIIKTQMYSGCAEVLNASINSQRVKFMRHDYSDSEIKAAIQDYRITFDAYLSALKLALEYGKKLTSYNSWQRASITEYQKLLKSYNYNKYLNFCITTLNNDNVSPFIYEVKNGKVLITGMRKDTSANILQQGAFPTTFSNHPQNRIMTLAEAENTEEETNYNLFIIPATVFGMPVTTITANALEGLEPNSIVIISDGIESIDASAFESNENVVSVIMGDSVTDIGEKAFYGCKNLKSVVLSKGLTTIGQNAFANCTALTSLQLPEALTTVGEYAFANNTALTELTVDGEKTVFAENAFDGCTALKIYGKTGSSAQDIAKTKNITFEELLPTVTEITIKTLPTKTTLSTGSIIEDSDMVLTVTYSDGTTKEITSGWILDYDNTVAGEGTVTVHYEQGTTTFTVQWEEVAIEGISLPETLELAEGKTYTLLPTITPDNATGTTITWESSDQDIATVNKNGRVTAIKAGTTTITATTANGEKTATCKVTVTDITPTTIDVTGVTLDKTTISLEEGSETTLTATVAPADATNKTVTWKSSDTSVATVDNGKITAVNAGTATITVTTEDGSKTATCNVTVTPAIINVTGVTLDKTTVSLEEGNTTTLTATVAPTNATNKAVTWKSSDTSIATVDNGKITAVNAGTATITVTTEDGGKTATCKVTVTSAIINVTGVTLDKTTVSLEEGNTTTLTATVAPANATNKAVTWKSSNTSVATVNNGKVTAVKAGTATITVTTEDGSKTATCNVTVTPATINVTGVTLDKTTVSLEEGNTTTLTATVAPANATNKAVTWKSSNTSVATVNNGKVTAVKAGTATITVTTEDGSKTATCKVTVTPATINVTGVTLDKAEISMEEGKTTTLTATVAPTNATNKAVTWKTSDTSVATVDNGKITAVKAGTATITVTTADGGKTAACEIKVTAKAPEVNFSDVAADAWYVSYVYDLAGKGVINGITPTTFDPEGKITRGQFVKILAYASGDDLSAYSGDSVFADANAHWSKANINWAYTNKIVYGKSDTQFAPDANITRQEMAVMIKRYADYKNITLPQTNAPITFTDEAEIAAWAKEAVSAMQQANIISGFPDGTFAPQGNATRAQAAKMISVFLSL